MPKIHLSFHVTASATTAEEKPSDDPVQDLMGSIGKWQLFTCFVIFLLKFPVAWHQVSKCRLL